MMTGIDHITCDVSFRKPHVIGQKVEM